MEYNVMDNRSLKIWKRFSFNVKSLQIGLRL